MEKGQSVLTGFSPTKVCVTCSEKKERSEFYKHKSTKDRLRSECKICWNGLSLKYYHDNRPTRRIKARDYHYRKHYGISSEEFDEQCKAQNFLCAICEEAGPLVQDHCHTTHRRRSLLCARCNQGLGSFREDTTILQKAIVYITKQRELIGN